MHLDKPLNPVIPKDKVLEVKNIFNRTANYGKTVNMVNKEPEQIIRKRRAYSFPRTRTTPEERQNILNDLLAGMSPMRVAKKYRRSTNYIYQIRIDKTKEGMVFPGRKKKALTYKRLSPTRSSETVEQVTQQAPIVQETKTQHFSQTIQDLEDKRDKLNEAIALLKALQPN